MCMTYRHTYIHTETAASANSMLFHAFFLCVIFLFLHVIFFFFLCIISSMRFFSLTFFTMPFFTMRFFLYVFFPSILIFLIFFFILSSRLPSRAAGVYESEYCVYIYSKFCTYFTTYLTCY